LISGKMLQIVLFDEITPSAAWHRHKQDQGPLLLACAIKLLIELIEFWNMSWRLPRAGLAL